MFHDKPFIAQCNAVVTAIDPVKGIVLDQSIAYAESGGQLGDTGILCIDTNGVHTEIPFTDTQKGVGRMLLLKDFPTIPVETSTYHKVDPENVSRFYIGQRLTVKIDTERRGLLTISHSGIHLVLMGLEQRYPGIYSRIKGCSIKPDGARLDFHVENKFVPDDVTAVQDFVQNMISRDKEMVVYAHEQEPEALYWQLDDYAIPCGGTHLQSTGGIGEVLVKRENLGKATQRISYSFRNYKLPLYEYPQ